MSSTRPCLRVAIVGFGPKGLFALERLLHHAHRLSPHAMLEIDIFEPHPVPGAGPVYDPGQPEYLRMNVPADHLDMWDADSRAAPTSEQLSFSEWRRATEQRSGDDRYPPRGQVGRYLAEGFTRLRRHVPTGTSVTLWPVAACAVHRVRSNWAIVGEDHTTRRYDEVLVSVGHGIRDEPCPARPWNHAAPLIPAVFPVTDRLSPEQVAPGATVAIRGFALTFLDAAITLSEGRGGVFETDGHPYRLHYTPSKQDVGVMVPFSRTGWPMMAKPELELAAGIPALESITNSGQEQILTLSEGFGLRDDLLAILTSTSAASLLSARGHRLSGERLRRATTTAGRWLGTACDGAPPTVMRGVAASLERSLDVSTGLHPPDLHWALGHTWRSLYPALVARLSGTGLADRDWPEFRSLAAQMERVSFGPPTMNAAKLLALIAAGRIDLSHVTAARMSTVNGITSIWSRGRERVVDAVVNAVLPGPGVPERLGGLLGQMVADGYARIVSRGRGLEVAPDSGCIGRDGRRTPGLCAIGRPTEDSVIGNDTLSRTLHPQADLWGHDVARRSAPGVTTAADFRPRGAA